MLEEPVSRIFDDLESGKGISENEAELLIRWLWKITGLGWIAAHPDGTYTEKYTLRERVLNPIDEVRENLLFAVSLVERISSKFNDLPMGVDSRNDIDAIFASGVFSKIAMLVTWKRFDEFVPDNFSKMFLSRKADSSSNAKLFYPKIGFEDDIQSIGKMWLLSDFLSARHDEVAQIIIERADSLKGQSKR